MIAQVPISVTVTSFPAAAGNPQPFGLCIAAGSLWVANESEQTISQFNFAGSLLASFPVGDGSQPNGAAQIAYDGTFLWITNTTENLVTKLSLAGAIIGNYATGVFPYGVCYDGLGNIWVVNNNDNTVTKILAATGAVLGTFAVNNSPFSCVADNLGNIWVTCGFNTFIGSVQKLNQAGAVLNTVVIGDGPIGICFDGVNIWVVCFLGAPNVFKILATSAIIVSSLTANVGNLWGVAFDGTYIWVLDESGGFVDLFLASNGSRVLSGPFPAGFAGSFFLAFDGAAMWTASATLPATVSKMILSGATPSFIPPAIIDQNQLSPFILPYCMACPTATEFIKGKNYGR